MVHVASQFLVICSWVSLPPGRIVRKNGQFSEQTVKQSESEPEPLTYSKLMIASSLD